MEEEEERQERPTNLLRRSPRNKQNISASTALLNRDLNDREIFTHKITLSSKNTNSIPVNSIPNGTLNLIQNGSLNSTPTNSHNPMPRSSTSAAQTIPKSTPQKSAKNSIQKPSALRKPPSALQQRTQTKKPANQEYQVVFPVPPRQIPLLYTPSEIFQELQQEQDLLQVLHSKIGEEVSKIKMEIELIQTATNWKRKSPPIDLDTIANQNKIPRIQENHSNQTSQQPSISLYEEENNLNFGVVKLSENQLENSEEIPLLNRRTSLSFNNFQENSLPKIYSNAKIQQLQDKKKSVEETEEEEDEEEEGEEDEEDLDGETSKKFKSIISQADPDYYQRKQQLLESKK